jgi:glyceraldehyde-3-phosphate dehydrogenase (NADP+)
MSKVETYPIYCGGEFISTANELIVRSPFSGETIGRTFLANADHINKAFSTAQQASKQLAQLPSYEKFKALRFIADALERDKERLAMILAAESAKPLSYARYEIERAAQTFLNAAEECKRLPGELLSLDWTPAGKGRTGMVKYFPVGIVIGIAPFNFPMNLAVHKIAPAIAAGCPIILKPASSTPLSTLELARIINQTDLPKGSVSILPMNREVGNALVQDERAALLSFTGSPEVGWAIKKLAGKKKVVLELGGNAGTIVASSADVVHAAERAVVGGFAYSGQVCIHAQRFIVHESLYNEFVERVVERTKQLIIGDPLDNNTQVSSMIDVTNSHRVLDWIAEAKAGGAVVQCGGAVKDGIVLPTVLTNTKPEMRVCREEVFGPVITIESYSTFDDAIAYVNNTRFGLQAGIFTNNIHELDLAFEELEVGGVIHNEVPTFRMDHMPYGGVKDSGLGREGVKYAILDMMEPRILVK